MKTVIFIQARINSSRLPRKILKKIEDKTILEIILDRLKKLKSLGILQRQTVSFTSKKDLLGLQSQLRGRVSTGEKDFTINSSIE